MSWRMNNYLSELSDKELDESIEKLDGQIDHWLKKILNRFGVKPSDKIKDEVMGLIVKTMMFKKYKNEEVRRVMKRTLDKVVGESDG